MNQRIDGHVHVGHLTGRMHAGVGATGRAHDNRNPEHCRQRLVEHPGHGPLPGLRRPPGELGSVVGDVEPQTNVPATGIDGGHVHVLSTASGLGVILGRLSLGDHRVLGLHGCDRLLGLGLFGLSFRSSERALGPPSKPRTRPARSAARVGLGRHRLLPHQLDDRHRSVVTLAVAS